MPEDKPLFLRTGILSIAINVVLAACGATVAVWRRASDFDARIQILEKEVTDLRASTTALSDWKIKHQQFMEDFIDHHTIIQKKRGNK